MKAIYIEEKAVRYLAQTRTFQSGDFDDALALTDFFLTGKDVAIQKIQCVTFKNIGYIYHTENNNLLKNVIFDIDTLGDFSANDYNQIVTIVQKVLKFSLKQWDNFPLNISEKIINDNHAILFPFPYRDENPFKIMVNLSPDKGYTEKRNIRCIYVVKMGIGNFSIDDYKPINLKAINNEALQIISETEKKRKEVVTPSSSPLQVSSLDNVPKAVNGYMSFEAWIPMLSKIQHDFVTRSLKGNERLEGAAGTGKTISLVLKAIWLYRMAKYDGKNLRMLFLCHSIATKDSLKNMIESTAGDSNILNPENGGQFIELTTLQEWCTKYLGNSIGQSELLDADAQECKDLQFQFIRDIYAECLKRDYPTYECICSQQFKNFIASTDLNLLIELIASEISITIKGRASSDLDTYKQLPRLEGSIPVQNEADYNFLFLIYEKYQDNLIQLGYFDNDDISLSSALQLASPIWKRRRKEMGYDVLFIDEVHLFSYNELAIFHNLNKDEKNSHIIYAIDKTQAIGDRGLTKQQQLDTMRINDNKETRYNTMFRCSPQVVDLAFSVLVSGAEMFLNFDNPLDKIIYSFTNDEERKAKTPVYKFYATDEEMINDAFKQVDSISKGLGIQKDKILLVSVNQDIHQHIIKYATEKKKPIEILKRRGDITTIKCAERNMRYVLGFIDYIGGLEFDAVVIVGVDKGRVPNNDGKEGTIYQSYEWHNRMYVAITRAKYAVAILGNKSYTESPLLRKAIDSQRIVVEW